MLSVAIHILFSILSFRFLVCVHYAVLDCAFIVFYAAIHAVDTVRQCGRIIQSIK